MADHPTFPASSKSAQDESKQLELALLSHRLAARIIDWLVVGVALIAIQQTVWGSLFADEAFTLRVFFWTALFEAIAVGYEIALVATKGHTFGKFTMGISVSQVSSSLRPGWKRSAKRFALPYFLFLIPYAGIFLALLCYLSPVWDRNRRGWHDKIGGTRVLKTGPAPPYQLKRGNPTQDSH